MNDDLDLSPSEMRRLAVWLWSAFAGLVAIGGVVVLVMVR